MNEYLNSSHGPLKMIERKAEKVQVAFLELEQGICGVNCVVLAIGKQSNTWIAAADGRGTEWRSFKVNMGHIYLDKGRLGKKMAMVRC